MTESEHRENTEVVHVKSQLALQMAVSLLARYPGSRAAAETYLQASARVPVPEGREK